ncbi:MAG: hypothetical protein LQ338_001849 [Usnochroma carphineum]|nr:MAG: hypothetical protein LQ338_001849 [Usnochroma carphineum]
MGLVEYSESESSDVEQKPEPAKIPKAGPNDRKPAFQKVVDRSNPHKIRVNLPEPVKEPPENNDVEGGPLTKKARTDGGAFGGFNSFLPAPKRSGAVNGAPNGAGARRGGLGSGVNLKTGATPGFSREPVVEANQDAEDVAGTADENGSLEENGVFPESTGAENTGALSLPKPQSTDAPREEPKKQGNPMMFKPLSVARKPQKKKAVVANGDVTATPKGSPSPLPPKVAPKVSLFSAEKSEDNSMNGNPSRGAYQPMIYGSNKPETSIAGSPPAENPYIQESEASTEAVSQPSGTQGLQSLDTIASDLNLSASAKRQLFGRQKPSASAINVVNFNTDQEYAANELLREAGEQVQHNPVRAIAPGKHSLKQLVNAASNQKDALEEQFASGRRNKKEAGSKYGW